MTDTRPLLFFDSGVGGLSVLAPAAKLLPRAPLVYVADSAGFPYGTRSESEIAARVIEQSPLIMKIGISGGAIQALAKRLVGLREISRRAPEVRERNPGFRAGW